MDDKNPSFNYLKDFQSATNTDTSGQIPSAIAQLLSIPLSTTPSTSQAASSNPNLNVSAFASLDLTTISPDLIQQVRSDYQRQAGATNENGGAKEVTTTQLPKPVHSGFIDTSDPTPTPSTSQIPDGLANLPNDYEGILAALKRFQNPPQDPRIRQAPGASPTNDPRPQGVSGITPGLQDPRIRSTGGLQPVPSNDSLEKLKSATSHSHTLQDPRIRPKSSIYQPQASRAQRNPRPPPDPRTKPNIFRQRKAREDAHKYPDSRGKGYVDRDAVSTNEIALDPRSVIQYDDYLEDSTKIIGDGSVQNSNGRRRKANPPTEMTYPHKMPRTNERKDSHAGGAKARNLLPVFEFSDPSNDPSIPKGPRADYISAEKPYPIDKYKWNSQNDVSDQIEPTKSAPAPPIPQKTTAISPAVLIELSKIAEDGTIFTILEQIRRMQVDREEELFDQRKKLLEEHDKERNKLHAKEILGALDPREVEALERKLFTELRTLDKSIVAEMDKIVQKQQQALQDANVPLFFTTTDKDAIAKQHKILGLLSEMAP